MSKKWRLVLALAGLLIIYFSYNNVEDKNTLQAIQQEVYDSSQTKDKFANANYDIQQLLIRTYQPLINGPTGTDDLKGQVDGVLYKLNGIIKEMEEMEVPEKYVQAHQDLLAAYESFLPIVTEYQKKVQEAISQEAVDSPANQELNAAYQPISQAAEQWYTIYKKKNKDYVNDDGMRALGNSQDQLVYENYVETVTVNHVRDVEEGVLRYVGEKNYDGVFKMQLGVQKQFLSFATYLKHTKVAEPYTAAHQNLLNAYSQFITLIETGTSENMNEEYLEKFKTQYQEWKQAVDEWNLVLQQQITDRESEYMSEEDFARSHYGRTNYDIHQLLIRSYRPPVAGPGNVDKIEEIVDELIAKVNRLVKEMEELKVSKDYEQAHQELLAAYQNFLLVLTDYQEKVQEAVEQETRKSPSNQELYEAYRQISQASEQWFNVYKKINKSYGYDTWSVLGSLQDQLVYEDYIQGTVSSDLGDIENNILPYVEQKNYDAVFKMHNGPIYDFTRTIAYMKQTIVPKPYEKVHQNLLNTYIDFSSLMKSVDKEVNDEYLEKYTAQYKELKKAVDEWNKVYQQEFTRIK